MAYFLNLFSPDTWAAAQNGNFTLSGFREAQRTAAKRIGPGDVFLCYIVGLSRWCGALEVLSESYEDATPFYSDPDPFCIRFRVRPIVTLHTEQAVPVFIDSLWNALTATRDIPKGASGWAVGFRGSLRSLPQEDGDLILEHLKAQAAEPVPYPFDDRDKRQLQRVAKVPAAQGDVIVEVPEADDLEVAAEDASEAEPPTDLEARTSLKVQLRLAQLGSALGFKVWIAPGDRKWVASQAEADEVDLLERLPFNYEQTTLSTIEQIDVIWIKGRSIVRAFEVEHTTAVYSGLLRMADLLALQPNLSIRLHIVAPEDKRDKVLRELRRPVFSLLERGPLYDSCTYIPYGALEEVAALKHLTHMSDAVLDEYAEHAAEAA